MPDMVAEGARKEEKRDLGWMYGAKVVRSIHRKEPKRTLERMEDRQRGDPQRTLPEKEAGTPAVYDISLENEMMRGKELLKHYTIATVSGMKGGMSVDRNSLSAALREALGDNWEWNSRPFRDGRFLVTCPSSEEARGLESIGTLHLPLFSVTFEQWWPDMGMTGKADGGKRWVVLRDVPLFCWHRDTIAKLVGPIGELLLVDEQGSEFVDDVRAAIRVRQGKELPSNIRVGMDTWKHVVTVEMESGQEVLPWSTGKRLEGGAAASTLKKSLIPEKEAPLPPRSRSVWTRIEKGKGLARDSEHDHRGGEVRPLTGVIIREGGRRPENRAERVPGWDRSAASQGPAVAGGPRTGSSRQPDEDPVCPAAVSASQAPEKQGTEMEMGRHVSAKERLGSAESAGVLNPDAGQGVFGASELEIAIPNVGSSNHMVPGQLGGSASRCPEEVVEACGDGAMLANQMVTGGEGESHGLNGERAAEDEQAAHVLTGSSEPNGTQREVDPLLAHNTDPVHLDGSTVPCNNISKMNDALSSHAQPSPFSSAANHTNQHGPSISGPNLGEKVNIEAHFNYRQPTLLLTQATPIHHQDPPLTSGPSMKRNINIDLSKMKLRSIRGTLSFVTDEVWEYYQEKEVQEKLEKDKSIGTNPPKRRGRPKKVQSDPGAQAQSTRKEQEGVEDASDLINIPITLADWPDQGIVSRALMMGVAIGQTEEEQTKYIAHMRAMESMRTQGGSS
ncbi:hypothetical protein J5N97_012095 [Dioscorea zingiberensis]|uniref:DUF4283 domain-containing protein n=1 Tax=Dioscorea zingiberensis TaxID=325984 RepID=A0A9D5HHD3_9LILI|nr:hypothetical protein J5N97_012095 [Dioscorea zingiberensis]